MSSHFKLDGTEVVLVTKAPEADRWNGWAVPIATFMELVDYRLGADAAGELGAPVPMLRQRTPVGTDPAWSISLHFPCQFSGATCARPDRVLLPIGRHSHEDDSWHFDVDEPTQPVALSGLRWENVAHG